MVEQTDIFTFGNMDFSWVAYLIGAVIVVWQIYDLFKPNSKPVLNPQPEIYKRLEEIKQQRRDRNTKGLFNFKDLTKYDGYSNPQLYIALKNDVFDVSNSNDFKENGTYHPMVAQEVSVNFAKCEGNPEYFFKYGEIDLTPEENQQLDATYAAFKANYKKVGTLYKDLPQDGNDKKNI